MTDLLTKVREEYHKALEVLEEELKESIRVRISVRPTPDIPASNPAPTGTPAEPQQPASIQDRTVISQEIPERNSGMPIPEQREAPKRMIWVGAFLTATAIAVLAILLYILSPAVNQFGMEMFEYIRQLVAPDNEAKYYYGDYNPLSRR